MPGRRVVPETELAGLLDLPFRQSLHMAAIRRRPGGVTGRLLRQRTEPVCVHIIGLEPYGFGVIVNRFVIQLQVAIGAAASDIEQRIPGREAEGLAVVLITTPVPNLVLGGPLCG
jgi:hypothetical protein